MEQQHYEEKTSEEVSFQKASEQGPGVGTVTQIQTEPEAMPTPPITLAQSVLEIRTTRAQKQGALSTLLTASILILLASIAAVMGVLPASVSRMVPIAGGLLLLITLLYSNARQRRAERKLRHLYQQLEDKRLIGVLIDASVGNGESARIARVTLTRLLPTLTPSDPILLTEEQRRKLYRSLTEWSPPMRNYHDALQLQNDYTVAALKALQQMGYEDSIPTVTELTCSSSDRIRNAANACLPSLQTNQENARNRQILLRAAMPAPLENTPDTLLRASAPTESGTPPEQLLRPSEAEGM
jgi:hypothetical protein